MIVFEFICGLLKGEFAKFLMASRYKIRVLIQDLEQIERECLPESQRVNETAASGAKDLDAFKIAKRNLTNFTKELEEGIEEREKVIEEFGRCPRAVELRQRNEALMKSVDAEYTNLKKAYEKEASKRKNKMSEEDKESLKTLVELFGERISDLKDRAAGRQKEKKLDFARNLMVSRAEEREREMKELGKKFPDPKETGPLSQQTQEFLTRKEAHDADFDRKLDHIQGGIQRVGNIARDIGNELDVQEKMMEDIDTHMDAVDAKFRANNRQLKRLVAQSGGNSRICILMTLLLVLFALVAYIFNIV